MKNHFFYWYLTLRNQKSLQYVQGFDEVIFQWSNWFWSFCNVTDERFIMQSWLVFLQIKDVKAWLVIRSSKFKTNEGYTTVFHFSQWSVLHYCLKSAHTSLGCWRSLWAGVTDSDISYVTQEQCKGFLRTFTQ